MGKMLLQIYLNSQRSGSQAPEAAVRVLLPRQARHGTSYEVDETAVAMVLDHASQCQDYH